MSDDIFIGFEERPEGLEKFLEKEGYTEIEKDHRSTIFSRKDDISTQVFYYPTSEVVEEEEVPNWAKSRRTIVSEININFPFTPYKDVEEAHRIADRIIDQYKGIRYDQNNDEFTEF